MLRSTEKRFLYTVGELEAQSILYMFILVELGYETMLMGIKGRNGWYFCIRLIYKAILGPQIIFDGIFGCSGGLRNYVLGAVGRLSILRRCRWCSVGGVGGDVNLSCVLWVLRGYMTLCILIYVWHRWQSSYNLFW